MPAGIVFYFAYGSNLYKDRMQLDNDCNFNFKCIAKLENWRLNFDRASNKWRGGVADIIAEEGDHLWGVVWETDAKGVDVLDRQENTRGGVYAPISVTVEANTGEKIVCRTYHLVQKSGTLVPPSRYYKEVIIRGALQNNLPQDYLTKLKAVLENDFVGEIETFKKLGLQ